MGDDFLDSREKLSSRLEGSDKGDKNSQTASLFHQWQTSRINLNALSHVEQWQALRIYFTVFPHEPTFNLLTWVLWTAINNELKLK